MKTIFDFNKMIGDSSQGEIVVSLLIVFLIYGILFWALSRAIKRDKARNWPTRQQVKKASAHQLHLWNKHLPSPRSRSQFEVLRLICDRSAELIIEKPRKADESSSRVRMQQAEAIRQASALGNVYMPEDHGCF